MRPRVFLFGFLIAFCIVFNVDTGFAAPIQKKIATTNYVDTKVTKDNGNVVIQNDTNKVVSVSNNPTETALNTGSKTVTTVGWADTYRTSKVKSKDANNSTVLVDMWIEE